MVAYYRGDKHVKPRISILYLAFRRLSNAEFQKYDYAVLVSVLNFAGCDMQESCRRDDRNDVFSDRNSLLQ